MFPSGPSSLPIHLDDIVCTGAESRLVDCSHTVQHNCRHSEDAGVQCNSTCELEWSENHGKLVLVAYVKKYKFRESMTKNSCLNANKLNTFLPNVMDCFPSTDAHDIYYSVLTTVI